jgi:hypothetical protein
MNVKLHDYQTGQPLGEVEINAALYHAINNAARKNYGAFPAKELPKSERIRLQLSPKQTVFF